MDENKKAPSSIGQFIKKLGPGLITGASDDDPSGIATYSQAGAQFGLATLWTAIVTFPLMIVVQEMCARIGMATSKDLTSNIKAHYSKTLLWIIILLTVPAITLNIAADVAGMGAVANLVFPHIPAAWFSVFFISILMVTTIFLSYEKIVAVLKYFCISLVLYLIIPFYTKVHFWEILKSTFVPQIKFTSEYVSILVAILGTTISPYLFFWQATMETEGNKTNSHGDQSTHRTRRDIFRDIAFGMFSSNIVMYFIILTSGTVLYNGGSNIDTVEQAAKALEPFVGKNAYLLFATGIIGTGFLTIPILSGCSSYILSIACGWSYGLDKKLNKAKCFYSVLIISLLLGLSIDIMNISPIKALLWTAILYGLSAPILILVLLDICNNKKIMGKYTNGKWTNIIGGCAFAVMAIAALLMLYFQLG